MGHRLLAHQLAHVVQRCGGHACPTGGCRHEDERLARSASGTGPVAPPIVGAVLRSPGTPLGPQLRADMERRLGYDFSAVRVHTDAGAVESAAAMRATAYTVGSHIAFASGHYAPGTPVGRQLLAHELAHVVQQAGATVATGATAAAALEIGPVNTPAEREAERVAALVAAPETGRPATFTRGTGPTLPHAMLQRACPQPPTNIAATPSAATCTPGGPAGVSGSLLFFCQDSTELVDGQADFLADLVREAKLASSIEVHGNASREGPAPYNTNLACMRADAIAAEFRRAGTTASITLFTHGETAAYGSPQFNRNVAVAMTLRSCGPDATDWFVRQVAAAKTDPAVLAVQRDLADAGRLAGGWGFSAEQLAIGAVAEKVVEQEVTAGRPTRTPEATSQLTAAVAGQRELGGAEAAIALGAVSIISPLLGDDIRRAADLGRALLAIRRAAVGWRDLVGTGRRYDFKNDTGTMMGPVSATCPKGCRGTITLCPTSGSDCYQTDVPGNLFYAHVGRFVGWTELVLQLGSQFAQLASTRGWDPPEDTRMISLGFALPDPLSDSALCAALAGSRSIFALHPCANCSEQTSATIR
jgi:outer membrane protein OmpA-like peptidoglycan-associated protein